MVLDNGAFGMLGLISRHWSNSAWRPVGCKVSVFCIDQLFRALLAARLNIGHLVDFHLFSIGGLGRSEVVPIR